MLDARITLTMLTLSLAACDARTEDPPTYELQVTEQPPAVVGERSHLVLDVLRSDGTKVTQFEAHHGQAMHLIAATYDLEDFHHVHPRLGADGAFSVELDFGRASPYALFAEVTPKGADGQVLRNTVWPAGARPAFAQLAASTAFDGRAAHRATLQGTRLTLAPLDKPLRAGVPVELSIAVDDGKGEAVELQEWMGMPIHAIAISQDFGQFLHFHGASARSAASSGHEHHAGHHGSGTSAPEARGALVVHATFPEPGLYKLWVQVKRGEHVITTPLVAQVSPRWAIGRNGVRRSGGA